MFARRTSVALAALALSGCWPRIPGQADDYLLPETSLVAGSVTMIDPIGGYWEDDRPAGGANWGVLGVPHPLTGVEGWGVPGACAKDHPGLAALEGGFQSGGTGTTLLMHGDGEVRMTWLSAANQWTGPLVEADWEIDADYDLAPLEFTGLGTFEIPGFATTPEGGFIVTGPEMGGETMGTVTGPEALTITWTSDGRAEWVLIRAVAADEGRNALETVSCVVDDSGSFTIPPELFEETSSTAFMALQVGAMRVEGGTVLLDGEEQGYVTTSAWLVQGAVAYGGSP